MRKVLVTLSSHAIALGRAILLAQAGLTEDCRGVTALEYGIVASILGLVLVGIFTSFGKTLTTLFSHVSASI
jgi:Flp pilus assembly pilin Flp